MDDRHTTIQPILGRRTIVNRPHPSRSVKAATRRLELKRRKAGRLLSSKLYLSAFNEGMLHGLWLLWHSNKHYTLGPANGWLLNIYPGSRGLHYDPARRGPKFHVKDDWNVFDVVRAVANRMEAADGVA